MRASNPISECFPLDKHVCPSRQDHVCESHQKGHPRLAFYISLISRSCMTSVDPQAGKLIAAGTAGTQTGGRIKIHVISNKKIEEKSRVKLERRV